MKRFTETTKWTDPWFRKLPTRFKCLWIFLCDNCDHAGVWEPDRETAEHFIGERLDWAKAIEAFQERIETLPCGKWRLVKFVQFQYGKLSEDCKPHRPVFQAMEKHGLSRDSVENGVFSDPSKPKPIKSLSEPFQRVQDKDKEKDKDKEPESDAEWLSMLAINTAYFGIDVKREYAHAQMWCQTNRRKCSRKFFINWLNRAERPMSADMAKPKPTQAEIDAEQARLEAMVKAQPDPFARFKT